GVLSEAGPYPFPPLSLRHDAGSARRERRLAVLGAGQVVADVLPGPPVGAPDHREAAVDGIRHGDAPAGREEGEAVVEPVRVLVLELQRPGIAAVLGLVD